MTSSLPVLSSSALLPDNDAAGGLDRSSESDPYHHHDGVRMTLTTSTQQQPPPSSVVTSLSSTSTTSTSAQQLLLPPPQQQQPATATATTGGGDNNNRDNQSTNTSISGWTVGTAQRQKRIVFSTPAQYGPIFLTAILTPFIVIMIRIIVLLHEQHQQEKEEDGHGGANGGRDGEEVEYGISHSVRGWILAWHFLFLLVLYMVVLPKQIDVRSNGTVGIKSFLVTYHIDDVVRAYQSSGVVVGIRSDFFWRPRLSYATHFGSGRVVIIRRRHGKWDVIVSPSDPVGFVHAIEEVVRGDDGPVVDGDDIGTVPSSLNDGPGEGTKPDLASAVVV